MAAVAHVPSTTPLERTFAVTSWHARSYRRTWRATITTAFLNPIFFLLSVGVLLGQLIDDDRAQLGGLSYVEFVAPGLLAATAMQMGANDAMWPVMAGIKWLRTYHAVLATPVRVGELRDREERSGEEKHRDQREAVERRKPPVVAALETCGERRDRRIESEPREQRGEGREDGECGRDCSADRGDGCEDRGRGEDADRGPSHRPEHELRDANRRREHRVVGTEPLDARHHRPHRVVRAHLHRGGCQQARRDELDVGEPAELRAVVVDQLAEQHADREQEEDRVQERRRDRRTPRAAVAARVPGRHRRGALERRRRVRDGRHQSTSVRPVSVRKTSSSVLRRTSTLSTGTPRSCTA